MRSRLAPVAAIVLVAAAVSAGLGGTSEPKDQKDTRCWGCHVAYTPPLQDFTLIVPPEEQTLAPGEAATYSVRVTNGYTNEITFTAITLDLRNAPSLKFGEAPSDIVGQVHNGTIDFAPGRHPGNQYRGSVTFAIEEGASKVGLCMGPATDPAPTLTYDLFVGNATSHTYQYTAAAGEAVCVPEADAARIGAGNVTVEAWYVFPDPANPTFAPTGAVEFEAILDVGFGADGAKQVLTSSKVVPKRADKLFNFGLEGVGRPASGESVLIVVNTTVHFEHKAGSSGLDWENITTRQEVQVLDSGSGVTLKAIVAPRPPTITSGATLTKISEAVGYASAFLLIASIWSGGMFGKASRRQLNDFFEGAKRRVAFHNFLSYGLTAAALVHTGIFLFRFSRDYQWTLGIIWGGIAILAMLGLGITGALQIPMIRKWSYGAWKWTHWWMSTAAIVFTIVHMLLDGANFGFVQEAIGWKDPFLPEDNVGVH